jgi:hypothetical protein
MRSASQSGRSAERQTPVAAIARHRDDGGSEDERRQAWLAMVLFCLAFVGICVTYAALAVDGFLG